MKQYGAHLVPGTTFATMVELFLQEPIRGMYLSQVHLLQYSSVTHMILMPLVYMQGSRVGLMRHKLP